MTIDECLAWLSEHQRPIEFAFRVFELGRKQERAMWELAKFEQEET